MEGVNSDGMAVPERMLFGNGLHASNHRRALASLRVLILCVIVPAIIVGQTAKNLRLLCCEGFFVSEWPSFSSKVTDTPARMEISKSGLAHYSWYGKARYKKLSMPRREPR